MKRVSNFSNVVLMASTPIIAVGIVVAILCVAVAVVYVPDIIRGDDDDKDDDDDIKGGEQAPVAIIEVLSEFTEVRVFEVINFTGNDSYDPDGGEIKLFTWIFGDGSLDVKGGYEVSNVSHNFSTIGEYSVTLIIIDDEGVSNSTSVNITVLSTDARFHDSFQLITLGGMINSAETNFTVFQDAKFVFLDFTFVNLQEAHLDITVNNPLGATIKNETDLTVDSLSLGSSYNITLKDNDLLYDGDYEVQVTLRDTDLRGEAVSVDLYIDVKYLD